MSNEENSKVIVYADKNMISISGISVKGLNTTQIEEMLTESIGQNTRIIGVTTENIEMDIYGAADYKLEDIAGKLLKVISLTDEITCSDIVSIASNGKLLEVDYKNIPSAEVGGGCVGERWIRFK